MEYRSSVDIYTEWDIVAARQLGRNEAKKSASERSIRHVSQQQLVNWPVIFIYMLEKVKLKLSRFLKMVYMEL